MMQKVTNNVYVETEFIGANNGFVVTKEGVVVIDPPMIPTDAVKWRDEVAKHGPVRYVINTEPHIDHHPGNHWFEGTVVGHEGTREGILAFPLDNFKGMIAMMAPDSLPLMEGFSFRPPTITFSERLTLYLGEHTFKLIHVPGHTPFQVMVYIPEERVVFTSDNVMYRVQVILGESLPYELLDSLQRVQELDVDVVIPGHGNVCDRSYIPEMKVIIQNWIDTVANAIKQGMSLEEAQDKISFLDRLPPMLGTEAMAEQGERNNVARLYEILTSKKK